MRPLLLALFCLAGALLAFGSIVVDLVGGRLTLDDGLLRAVTGIFIGGVGVFLLRSSIRALNRETQVSLARRPRARRSRREVPAPDYAAAAADVAEGRPGRAPPLDFTGPSVLLLDTFLDAEFPRGLGPDDDDWVPEDEEQEGMVLGFGSYLGEVLRREHGGDWGEPSAEVASIPFVASRTVKRKIIDFMTFPIGFALARLKSGPEEGLFNVVLQARKSFRQPFTKADAPAFLEQARFWEDLGKPENAVKLYEFALELDPDLADAKKKLDRVRAGSGRHRGR